MFKIFVYITLILAVQAFDEDAFKDVKELVESHGYEFEEHPVVTSDEYILGLHRIPKKDSEKVVLIMHQFLTSSADFVSMGNRSLAFLLADEGYDVWLGNARGNTYSKAHQSIDPTDTTFWDFTFDDVAKKDLPAIIDFIVQETGQEQIYYIGHGQGTTIFYIMASEMPEYHDKIKRMAALAPMAHMESMPNPIIRILDTLLIGIMKILNLEGILELLGSLVEGLGFNIDEIFAHKEDHFFVKLCDDDAMLVELCAGFMNLIYGLNSAQLERSKVPVIVTNAYAGSSFKQLRQYTKFYYNNKFSTTYTKLANIEVPNAIFYSESDWLVSIADVEHLAEDLKNSLELLYKIPLKEFNHIDFLFGKDAKELVYEPLFQYLEGTLEGRKIKAEL